jgi:hypothetical protein
MVVEALQARLKFLEDEILRFTKLAAQANETVEQDNYWRLAQDLQREARELRSQIAKTAEFSAPDHKSRGPVCISLPSGASRNNSCKSSERVYISNFPSAGPRPLFLGLVAVEFDSVLVGIIHSSQRHGNCSSVACGAGVKAGRSGRRRASQTLPGVQCDGDIRRLTGTPHHRHTAASLRVPALRHRSAAPAADRQP